MRTLERTFDGLYNQTMAECHVQARLNFSRWLLSIFPPAKVSVVAAQLGYSRIQDFNRFFKKHMHQSPTEWGHKERARIAAEGNNP
jgi:transcriptional regulator GlxA family with amidase domain